MTCTKFAKTDHVRTVHFLKRDVESCRTPPQTWTDGFGRPNGNAEASRVEACSGGWAVLSSGSPLTLWPTDPPVTFNVCDESGVVAVSDPLYRAPYAACVHYWDMYSDGSDVYFIVSFNDSNVHYGYVVQKFDGSTGAKTGESAVLANYGIPRSAIGSSIFFDTAGGAFYFTNGVNATENGPIYSSGGTAWVDAPGTDPDWQGYNVKRFDTSSMSFGANAVVKLNSFYDPGLTAWADASNGIPLFASPGQGGGHYQYLGVRYGKAYFLAWLSDPTYLQDRTWCLACWDWGSGLISALHPLSYWIAYDMTVGHAQDSPWRTRFDYKTGGDIQVAWGKAAGTHAGPDPLGGYMEKITTGGVQSMRYRYGGDGSGNFPAGLDGTRHLIHATGSYLTSGSPACGGWGTVILEADLSGVYAPTHPVSATGLLWSGIAGTDVVQWTNNLEIGHGATLAVPAGWWD